MKRRRRESDEEGEAAVPRVALHDGASHESPRTTRSAQPRRNQLASVGDASPCEREVWRGQAPAGNQAARTSPCVHSPARSPKARRPEQAQRRAGQRGRDDDGAAATAARAVIAAGGAEPLGSGDDCRGCDSDAARQADGQAPHPDAARGGACACRFCSWRFDSDDESDCARPCTARDSPRFRPQPVQGGWQGAAETGVRGAALGGAELGGTAVGGKKGESGGGRAEGEGTHGRCGEEEPSRDMGGSGIYPAGRFVGSDGECVVLAGWDGCCVLLDSSTLQQRASFRPPPGLQLGWPAACHVVAVPSHDGLTARLLLATSRSHAAFCCWDLLSSRLVSCFPSPVPSASPSPSPVSSPASSPPSGRTPCDTYGAAADDSAAATPATAIHMRGEPSASLLPAPSAAAGAATDCHPLAAASPPSASPCSASRPSPVCHTPLACCPPSPHQPPMHYSPCPSHSPPHATSPPPHTPLPPVPPVLPASPAPAASTAAAAHQPAGTQGTATAAAGGAMRAPQAGLSPTRSPPLPAPPRHACTPAPVPPRGNTLLAHPAAAGHGCSRVASGHGALPLAGRTALAGSAVERGSTGCAARQMKRRRRESDEEGEAAVPRVALHDGASHESPRTTRSAQPRRNQLASVGDASPCEREVWRGQAPAGNQAARTSPCVHSPARSPKARRPEQAQRRAGQRGRDDDGAAATAARAVIAAGGAEPLGSGDDCRGCDSDAARQADGQAPHPDAARGGACACRFCSWRFDSDDESDCARPCTARDSPRFRPQPVQGGWQGAAETGVRGAALGGAELGGTAVGGKKGESGGGRAEGEGTHGRCGEEEPSRDMGGSGIYPAGRFVGSDGECVVLAGWDGCCVLLDSSTLQQRASFRPPPGLQLGWPAACHVVAVPSHDGLTARLLLATSRSHAAFCCWDLLSSRLVSCFPSPVPSASPSPSPVSSPASSPPSGRTPCDTYGAAADDSAAATPATAIHMRGEPSASLLPAPSAAAGAATDCHPLAAASPPSASPCSASRPSPVCHTPLACCPPSPHQPPMHYSPCPSHSPPHATSPPPHTPLPPVPPVLPASPAPAASTAAAAHQPAGTQGTATAAAGGAMRAPQAGLSPTRSPPLPAPPRHACTPAPVPPRGNTLLAHPAAAGHGCSRVASGHGALPLAGRTALAGSAVERGSTGCAGAGEHAQRCTAEESSAELQHSRAAHYCCPPQPAHMHDLLTQQQSAAAPAGKVPLTPPASETPSLTPPTPQPASLPAPSPHPSPLPSPPNPPAHPPPPAPPSWKHLAPPEWHAAPCGASLAMVQAGGSDVRIWDVRDGGVAVSMQTEGAVERMACCSPILWLDEERLVVVEEGGSVGLWHVAGGEAVLFHHVQLMDQWGEAERVCAVAVMPGRRCNKRLFPSLSVLLLALSLLHPSLLRIPRGEGVTCAVASESAIYLADWSTPAVILHRIPSSHARPPGLSLSFPCRASHAAHAWMLHVTLSHLLAPCPSETCHSPPPPSTHPCPHSSPSAHLSVSPPFPPPDAMCFAGTSLFVALPSLPHEDFAVVQRIECSTGREGERYHLDAHVPRASRGPLLAVRVHAGRLFALHAGGVHVFRLPRAAQRGGGAGAGRCTGRDYLQQRAGQGRRGRERCGNAMAGVAAADTQAPVWSAGECGAAVRRRESGGAEHAAAVVLHPQAWRSGAGEGSDEGSEGEQGEEMGHGREEGYETEEDVDGRGVEGRQDGIATALECSGGDGGGVGSGRCGGETAEERRLVGVVGRRVNGLLHPAMDVVGDRLLLVSANHPPCLYSCP
ncbi:unnamed protein product [Closterium sp. Naga37s-1]|nr:unnamed protein product [Closterium sp. Naga37s-1]